MHQPVFGDRVATDTAHADVRMRGEAFGCYSFEPMSDRAWDYFRDNRALYDEETGEYLDEGFVDLDEHTGRHMTGAHSTDTPDFARGLLDAGLNIVAPTARGWMAVKMNLAWAEPMTGVGRGRTAEFHPVSP